MIAILLSTFNGERYLQEQLDSLVAQTYQDFTLIVRDDGSSDATIEILERHRARFPLKTTILKGKRLGYSRSFLRLLSTPSDASYFAFCDQDDVWHSDKIEIAIEHLNAVSGPACYTSAFEIVDDSLNFLQVQAARKKLELGSSLVESLIWGCTVVLNREGRDKVIFGIEQALPISHDWWTYLVMSAIGQIISDPHPRMKYRQHTNNLVGFQKPGFSSVFRQISGVRKRGFPKWGEQARSFYSLHSAELTPVQIRLFENIKAAPSSFRARLTLAFSGNFRRQKALASYFLRIMILFGYC